MVVFPTLEARDFVLERGPWFIQNQMLTVRKWTPDLEELSFDIAKILVWVLFKRVPLEFFIQRGLGYIASAVGIPQYMDRFTAERSRLEYARVCVEVDVRKEIPSFVEVVRKNGIIATVEVVVPWLPVECSKCLKFGHREKACSIKQNKVVHKKAWVQTKDNNVKKLQAVAMNQSAKNDESIMELTEERIIDKIEEVTVRGKGVMVDSLPSDDLGIAGSSTRFDMLANKSELDGDDVIDEVEFEEQLENQLESRKVRSASLGVIATVKACKSKRGSKTSCAKGRGRGSPGAGASQNSK